MRKDRISRLLRSLAWVTFSVAHTLAVVAGMGGWSQISTDWPIATHDHPVHYHYTTITPTFLRQSWTTAGYDPSFMAGYAKSVIFPQSSTIGEVVAFLTGTKRPAFTYKCTVLASVATLPWLIGAGTLLLGLGVGATSWAVGLFLVYLWTDFPINYAEFGMHAYILCVPLGLVATAGVVRFLKIGGIKAYAVGAFGCVLVLLVHLTSAMFVAPAVALAYVAALVGNKKEERLGAGRHVGYWLIPVLVLALNAFWWWPGLRLTSTVGASGFVFAHPEGVLKRLAQVAGFEQPVQPEIQAALWAVGVAGLVLVLKRDRVAGTALLVFTAAGFGWGYLAGAWRALDFLQPGRHTYAFYTGMAVASGAAIAGVLDRMQGKRPRLGWWLLVGLLLLGTRLFGPALVVSVRERLALQGSVPGRRPFMTSEPTPRLKWVLEQVRANLKPGQRLLYEEGGFEVPGAPDPFQNGRFSGLLPSMTRIEVLGGPYLHVALKTNFTQFGEGKLFGKADWDRDHFLKYAAIYEPAAILCWTPVARAFCQANPDLVEVVAEEGPLLFGRIRKSAEVEKSARVVVEASPGALVVKPGGGELDGVAVLRYHSVPFLRAKPRANLREVWRGEDPVSFIELEAPQVPTRLEMDLWP